MLPDLRLNWSNILELTNLSVPVLKEYVNLLDKIDVNCEKILQGDKQIIEDAKRWVYDAGYAEKALFEARDK
ncbi:unnamed protein product [Strongylus vulgaris]|uniref:Uncharacterized protein n=1 Tax=Strongylus vulgaris TaxID=40348 RepID=A0A3P7KBT3_STRVU|nr:unnamed protein product [Strongylus vulgaris]